MLGLQVEPRQVELVGLRERGLRDRQILDCQAGRVEQRDLVAGHPARCVARENVAELGDIVFDDEPGLDRRSQLAAVARLLKGVCEWKILRPRSFGAVA